MSTCRAWAINSRVTISGWSLCHKRNEKQQAVAHWDEAMVQLFRSWCVFSGMQNAECRMGYITLSGSLFICCKKIFTQWNMKIVLPADTTFVQMNRMPVELRAFPPPSPLPSPLFFFSPILAQMSKLYTSGVMCRKDLQFNAILNRSDWGIINKPKCDLSYMFFDMISNFG